MFMVSHGAVVMQAFTIVVEYSLDVMTRDKVY
jgi:hypothetical protein